jgi:hypothetical protein
MKDNTASILFMLLCAAGVLVTAYLQEPYWLAAASVLLVQKQLGRIVRSIRKE